MGKTKGEPSSDNSSDEEKTTGGTTGGTQTAISGTRTKESTTAITGGTGAKTRTNKSKEQKRQKKTTDKTGENEQSKDSKEKIKETRKPRTEEERRRDREALKKVKEDICPKEQAKEEEKKYLKLRAAEVLDQYKPKSKAAQLRGSDDKMPVNYAKQMQKLRQEGNFGAVKAMFLSMRPNGKYAVWQGKEHDEKNKNKKIVPLTEQIARSRRQQAAQAQKGEGAPKAVEKTTGKPSGNQYMTAYELANLPVLPYVGPNDPLPQRDAPSPPIQMVEVDDVIDAQTGEPWWLAESKNLSSDSESQTADIVNDIVNYENFTTQAETALDLRDKPGVTMDFRDDDQFYHFTGRMDKMTGIDHYFKKERYHEHLVEPPEGGKRGPVFYNTLVNVFDACKDRLYVKAPSGQAQPEKFKFSNEMTVVKYKPGVANIRGHEEELKKGAVKTPFVLVSKQADNG